MLLKPPTKVNRLPPRKKLLFYKFGKERMGYFR